MIPALLGSCLALIAYGFAGASAMILVLLACFLALMAYGLAGLVVWHRAAQLRRLDAEYRAFAMIANAKREVRRG